jgi:5-methylcytosine-specific restriction endonuclease McrA
MRVRDHIALSTAGAALLRPWLGSGALALWAGGVLIDADHYVWFCLRERRASPLAALQFFNEAHPPQHSATRALHTPAALVGAMVASLRWPQLRAPVFGMSVHIALDLCHDARMSRARAAALERDDCLCAECGARAESMDAHLARQPWLLPSYRAQNVISLCGPCHEAAHAG